MGTILKICVAICEYNPLHIGHTKHLNFIKEEIKPDVLAVILSGNFTQRGEAAIVDKYTRAIWAIKSGADIVFELPTVFATGNAEIFAKGALKLINALPDEKILCFGTESDNISDLIDVAKVTAIESKEYKAALKEELDSGIPFAKARYNAIAKTNPEINVESVLTPNNILGVEYIKAILQNNYDVKIKTLKRDGSYNDKSIKNDNPSALSIRTAISENKKSKTKSAVPSFVYKELPNKLPDFSKQIVYSLLTCDKEYLKKLPDVSEGLENKIKAIIKDNHSTKALIQKLKTKRYTETRLNRILTSALLKIESSFVKECLSSDLYLKVLAINKDKQDVLSLLSKSKYPIITRKNDYLKLSSTALECFNKDVFATDLYNAETGKKTNEFEMKLVEK